LYLNLFLYASVQQTGRVITGIWEVKVDKTLVAGQTNAIKCSLADMRLDFRKIRAVNILSVIDEAAAGVVTVYMPGALSSIVIKVIKAQNSIVIEIPAAAIAYVSSKTLVLEVKYTQ